MNALLRAATVLAVAAATLSLQASCARSVSSDGAPDPTLVGSGAKNPGPLTVCVSTDCPAPWATCGDGPEALCTTDTSRDIAHCGSCGTTCPQPPKSFHATGVCSNSKCALACDELSADCNHNPADGCEVYTGDDPNNCGGCGITCKSGDASDGGTDGGEGGASGDGGDGGAPPICWKGACGCPNGFAACGTECKNLQSDDLNCGACDKKCAAPTSGTDPAWTCGAFITPPNSIWTCAAGGCKMMCLPKFGDCNDNFCSDGCEVDEHQDPLNCGACGHKCDANQACVDGTCLCPPGTVRCDNQCVDINVDTNNCGACGNGCPGAEDDSANGSPTCSGGRCGYLCYAGFADCNNRINDGCEANIGTDPKHCGGCGTKCDAAQSQPCVLGQCLTKPCGPGPGTF